MKCGCEAVEGLAEYGAGTSDVETHESLAAGAEHFAVVEGESGFADKEVYESIVVKSESAAVEPYQEGCLRA